MKRKLKIVHVLAYYGDYLGGIQIYVKELAKKQKQNGHVVKIITSDKYGNQSEIDGIKIIRTKTLFSAFRVPFTPLLPFYLLKENCDILHVHLPLPWLDICTAFKKIIHKKTKVIIHIHNYLPVKSQASRILSFIHDHILIQLALKTADTIITPTVGFANSLNFQIPQNKHVVIPSGVDMEKFYPSDSYNKNLVLFVGRIIPEKGLHVLLDAMEKVVRKLKNTQLLIIGSKTYNYQHYYNSLLKKERRYVTIKNNISHSLMRKYYAKSACLVMPSLDLDSLGIVLLEAMSCGCPVITSDLPGPKSIIKNNLGLVAPKGKSHELSKAIIHMLRTNKSLRKKVRYYVHKNFSWDIIYPKIEKLYLS